MMRALTTSATGMVAQQHNLDVISNNLANVNTNGFKQQRAQFQDLMYETIRGAGLTSGNAAAPPENLLIGSGVRIGATTSNFSIGGMENTDQPLNLMITGDGFFKLKGPNGPVYTRDGSFSTNGDGHIVNTDGLYLEPDVKIEPNSTAITVAPNGEVKAIAPGASSAETVGTIEVTNFTNPGGLMRLGSNLFGETSASGAAQSGTPGSPGYSSVQSGELESSNVQVVTEMTRMITAQRAYEINSKAIQTADDMLGIVNGLKR